MKLLKGVLLALLLSLLVGLAIGTAIRLRLERPTEYIGELLNENRLGSQVLVGGVSKMYRLRALLIHVTPDEFRPAL